MICDCNKSILRILIILTILSTLLFIAVEICLFTSDQYVVYRCLEEEGLSYWNRSGNHTNKEKSLYESTQKKAAWIESAANFVRMTTGMITIVIFGYLSDRYGRRLALGLMILGEVFHIGITCIIIIFKLNPWLVILPGLLEGLFGGGLSSILVIILACLADLTREQNVFIKYTSNVEQKKSERNRWLLFTIFEGLASMSYASGSALAGIMIHTFQFTGAIICCVVLFAFSGVFIFALPETSGKFTVNYYSEERETTIDNFYQFNQFEVENDDNRSTDFKHEKFYHKILTKLMLILQAIHRSNKLLKLSLVLKFFVAITAVVDLQYMYIYLMYSPFMWNSKKIGLYVGITDAVSSILSILITTILYKWMEKLKSMKITNLNQFFKLNEQSQKIHNTKYILYTLTTILFVSFGLLILNRIMMSVAYLFNLPYADYIVYIAAVPRLFKNTLIAPLRTLISLCTDYHRQGLVLSFASFIFRIGLLISLTILPLVYSWTVSSFAGAVFIVCAALLLISIFLTVALTITIKRIKTNLCEQINKL